MKRQDQIAIRVEECMGVTRSPFGVNLFTFIVLGSSHYRVARWHCFHFADIVKHQMYHSKQQVAYSRANYLVRRVVKVNEAEAWN